MAVYFGADHVVWASQAGLYTNKQAIERCALTSIMLVCPPPCKYKREQPGVLGCRR